MARSPNAAPSANANGAGKPKRQSRPQGPRTLWLVLKEGTDAAAIREQIESVTFNGREVLKAMGTGVTPQVIKLQLTGGRNAAGEEEVESSVETQQQVEQEVGAAA